MGAPTFINTPGCIALEDKTNGPACAQALEPLIQCEFQACNSAACKADTNPADQQACATAADTGACSTQYNSALTACQTDYADGGAATTLCGTDPQIIDAICGSGM
jgi:hypothetical protein